MKQIQWYQIFKMQLNMLIKLALISVLKILLLCTISLIVITDTYIVARKNVVNNHETLTNSDNEFEADLSK